MPYATLWETICRLAGDDGTALVNFDEAVGKSAVPRLVATVEVRKMVEDGLIESNDESLVLTERGRQSCGEAYRDPGIAT